MSLTDALLGWLAVNGALVALLLVLGAIVDVWRGFWERHVSRWLGEDQERDRKRWARRRAIEARRRQEEMARDAGSNDAGSPYD